MLFMVRIVFHRRHSTCKCSIYNLSHVSLSLCLSVSLLLLLSFPRGQCILQSDIHILLRLRRALRHSIRIFLPEKITTISIYPSHAPITSPSLFGSRACATWLLPHRLGSVRIVRRWEYRPSRNLVRLLRYCQWSDHVWGFPSSCLLRYFVRCFLFSKECVTPVTTAYILLRLRKALRHSIRIFLPEKITTISIYPSHAPITSPNLFGSRACATWLLPHRLGSVIIVRRWDYRPSRNLVRLLRYCQWSDHVWGFPSSCLLRYFVRCFLFSKECVTLATTA